MWAARALGTQPRRSYFNSISGFFWFTFPLWLKILRNLKYLLDIWNSSAENSLFRSVTPFLIGLFGILMSSFLRSFIFLSFSSLSNVVLVKIFSHYVGYCVLCLTELSSFQGVCIINCWSQCIYYWCYISPFSSMRSSVAGFMLRSSIHLDLNFVLSGRYGSIYYFLHVYIHLCQQHLLKMISFTIVYFCLLCQKSAAHRGVD